MNEHHGTRAQLSPMSLQASISEALCGCIQIPGDKSISHRAIIFSALALGQSRIRGLLESGDVMASCNAMRMLGASIEQQADGEWVVTGIGLDGLIPPQDCIDLGNSGTSARLLTGLLAGLDGVAFLTGDASLRKRPMRRVIEPLTRMGCQFEATGGDRMPLMIRGAEQVLAIDYQLPVASAQVKSAVLLAGLYARSTTRILESVPTRDHSERMLAAMGCDIKSQPYQGGRELILTPPGRLQACDFTVPGDPSSAAFVIVAALIVPASQITLPNLCLNPTRTGLLQSLQEMGANIESQSPTEQSGEPTGLLTVQSSALKGGVVIPASRTASMIDEYPILAIAAAFAHGTTCMEGIAELRFKESDRLAAIVDGLRANSVPVRAGDDWLEVDGSAGKPIPGGGFVETRLDHRIAMSFLVLGLYANQPVTIDDAHAITTSFPNFIQSIRKLGGNID